MPIKLSTGRVIDERIIGLVINPVDKYAGKLTYGYDGFIPCFQECENIADKMGPYYLSKKECRELADKMIEQWTNYRASIK
jgi:hypothetical protein